MSTEEQRMTLEEWSRVAIANNWRPPVHDLNEDEKDANEDIRILCGLSFGDTSTAAGNTVDRYDAGWRFMSPGSVELLKIEATALADAYAQARVNLFAITLLPSGTGEKIQPQQVTVHAYIETYTLLGLLQTEGIPAPTSISSTAFGGINLYWTKGNRTTEVGISSGGYLAKLRTESGAENNRSSLSVRLESSSEVSRAPFYVKHWVSLES